EATTHVRDEREDLVVPVAVVETRRPRPHEHGSEETVRGGEDCPPPAAVRTQTWSSSPSYASSNSSGVGSSRGRCVTRRRFAPDASYASSASSSERCPRGCPSSSPRSSVASQTKRSASRAASTSSSEGAESPEYVSTAPFACTRNAYVSSR